MFFRLSFSLEDFAPTWLQETPISISSANKEFLTGTAQLKKFILALFENNKNVSALCFTHLQHSCKNFWSNLAIFTHLKKEQVFKML